MRKKLLVLSLCVALAAIAIAGASLAYFTDTKSATNTFTVGNVKIDLIESKFHRTGNDNSGDTSIPDPTAKAADKEFIPDGWTIFTDDEIKNDAKTYATEYLAVKGKNMVPGRGVAKCPYVVNTGANDAYVRIRVMIPSAANNDFVNVKDGGVITNQWCGTALKGAGEGADEKPAEFQHGDRGVAWPDVKQGVEKDGVTYDVYTFTRVKPLAAGAMTEWNVWNFIGINKDATSADIQKAVDAGAITATDKTMSLNVLVEADAIQAEGFANATEAFAAFDK